MGQKPALAYQSRLIVVYTCTLNDALTRKCMILNIRLA
jgi:hypothetical protein